MRIQLWLGIDPSYIVMGALETVVASRWSTLPEYGARRRAAPAATSRRAGAAWGI